MKANIFLFEKKDYSLPMKTSISLFQDVKENWKIIQAKYFPINFNSEVFSFTDVSEGFGIEFTLPNSHIHHFFINVKITQRKLLTCQRKYSLHRIILLEVAKSIIYQIGNYQIDEAIDPKFCQINHYGSFELNCLHTDEDFILEIAQAMAVGAKFSEYDQNVDARFKLLEPFNNHQLFLIKEIYRRIAEKFNFVVKDLILGSFYKEMQLQKYQIATLSLQFKNGINSININIFRNQIQKLVRNYEMDEDQAIYFIIKNFFKQRVLNLDTTPLANRECKEKEESNVLIKIANNFPNNFFELMN